MKILPQMKQLVLVTSLVLAWPLAALADSPPGPGPDHMMGGPVHEHGMADCAMSHGRADGGMFHGEEMYGEDGPLAGALRHLELTEAQQDKIFAILHAQAPQARELGKAMRKAHRGLHELVTTGPYDDAKAKGLADALGKAVAESTLLHARTHHQVLEILTPEQREALAHHGEHGPGHHGDHPPLAPK
jgi:protein CpxP